MLTPVQQSLEKHAHDLPVVDGQQDIMQFLASASLAPAPVIETDGRAVVLDLSATSLLLAGEPSAMTVHRLGEIIDAEMRRAGTSFAFGRYAENRALYDSENFAGAGNGERRTVHLGIDLFCATGTAVHAPLDGEVVIVANNTADLDYGPMLVLKHRAGQHDFHSLYGHLNLRSIDGCREGQAVRAGDKIAELGGPPENGNWPPHLHFQLILDLLGLGRDFPGVAYQSQLDFWLAMSPSPAAFFPECDAAALNALNR
ncbi:MAG: peptidoglycan DD-metalloendopeptidase family protein [Woeseiaceae bacterium]